MPLRKPEYIGEEAGGRGGSRFGFKMPGKVRVLGIFALILFFVFALLFTRSLLRFLRCAHSMTRSTPNVSWNSGPLRSPSAISTCGLVSASMVTRTVSSSTSAVTCRMI